MKKFGKLKPYGITALLTLISLGLMLFALRIYPFGDKTFLWTDADQYLSFQHYIGSTAGKNDVFYSWNNALGGNAFVQLAYYAFSPFNIIFMVLNDHMILAAHLVAYTKIVAASLTFFYCLDYLHREKYYLMKSALSMCYGLMGYMVFYGWNTSWMDAVILLPIIYIGIIKIIEGKSPLQYTAALCVSVISNFYIGFMLCIGSFILYTASLLLQEKKYLEGLKDSFIRYALFSLSAVGAAMFVLLPAYLGLPESRSESLKTLIIEMFFTVKPVEILSGLFTGQINPISSNAPLIYVGTFPLMLTVLFFVCKRASDRKKLVYAALLITFFLSFENSVINVMWHGMSYNAWFNYRYSFLMSFVLLLIAYDSFLLIRSGSVSKNEYLTAGAILFVIAGFLINDPIDRIRPISLTTDIILICLITGLLYLGYQYKRAFMAFIVLLMMFCTVANGYCYLQDTSIVELQYSKASYDAKNTLMQDAKRSISDDSFYRMETTARFGTCDGNLFNYNGVSQFASTENMDNLDFIKKLGVLHTYMWWSRYSPDMPEASESLLGFKYLLTDTLNSKDYENIGSSGEIQFYKNPNALPVLFPSETSGVNMEAMNDFDLQNEIWKSINGIDKNVFEANNVKIPDADDAVDVNNAGTADDADAADSAGSSKTLTITVNRSGSVYLSVPDSSYSSFKIEGTSQDKEISYYFANEIYYVGELSEGDTFNLIVTTNGDNYDLNQIVCYTENKSVIEENAAQIKNTDMEIDEVGSSHIEMSYKGNRKNIATTIPYDENWTVYDNGNKAAIQKNWNNFISFELDDADDHQIRLIYRPKGFKAGAAVSLMSVLFIVLYEIFFVCGLFRKSRKN